MAEARSSEALEFEPVVRIELDNLNTYTDAINKLETELDEANAKFRRILSESSQMLKSMSKKLGQSCVDKARPFYEAKEVCKKAQLECQNAAIQFQRACGIHDAAKETISLAEERFLSQRGEWEFDSAWQEMLNHATIKVMEAEQQRALSEKAHLETTAAFAVAEKKYQKLESKLLKHAIKSKPYFEAKEIFNHDLQEQRKRVLALQKEITVVKQKYSDSLQNLECISDRIHARRKLETKQFESLNVDVELERFERSEKESVSEISTDNEVEDDDEGFDSVSSSAGNQNSDWEENLKPDLLPDSITLDAASIS